MVYPKVTLVESSTTSKGTPRGSLPLDRKGLRTGEGFTFTPHSHSRKKTTDHEIQPNSGDLRER